MIQYFNRFKESLIIIVTSLTIFFWDTIWHLLDIEIQIRFSIFLLAPLLIYELTKIFNYNKKFFLIISFILLIFFTHYLINVYFYHFPFSKIALIKILFISYFIIFAFIYKKIILKNLNYIIAFYVIILSSLILKDFIFNYSELKNIFYSCQPGFFWETKIVHSENSHFAMTAIPIFFYFLIKIFKDNGHIKKTLKSIDIIIFTIFLFLVSFSLTLSFLISFTLFSILIFFYLIKIKKNVLLFIVLILLNIINYQVIKNSNTCVAIDQSAYDGEIFGMSEKFENSIDGLSLMIKEIYNKKEIKINDNQKLDNNKSHDVIVPDHISRIVTKQLSSQVYLDSFKIAFISLRNNMFGHGIDSYQYIHEKFYKDSKYPSHVVRVKDYNQKDGSNNFSKIIVEYGVFILLIFFLFLIHYRKSKILDENFFFLLILLFHQTFLRGAGYFNGGYLLILTLFIFYILDEKNKKFRN